MLGSVNPKASLTPQQGNRARNRLRLGASASLVLTHETRPCLIEDVSSSGARVRMNHPPARGHTAMLSFHELRLYCTVAWVLDDRCGLRFEKELPLEDMQGLLWITQNRGQYERICNQSRALDWSSGRRD